MTPDLVVVVIAFGLLSVLPSALGASYGVGLVACLGSVGSAFGPWLLTGSLLVAAVGAVGAQLCVLLWSRSPGPWWLWRLRWAVTRRRVSWALARDAKVLQ